MNVLDVRDLEAGYGERPVVAGISFGLAAGEFVSVLGPNGSGKTTLLKAVLRLLPRIEGPVEIEGRDAARLGPRLMARSVAYVPQFPDASFAFTVEEVVLMGRYAHLGRFGRVSEAEASFLDGIMDLARIGDLRHKPLGRLSGGERQRVHIARALAQDAPLLLLDEPSTHLDIAYQVEIYSLLDRLRREKGTAVLCAEHNINLAALFSDRLLFLKDGRPVAQGPPRRLITRKLVREVFGAEVDVRRNPRTSLPEVSLIPTAGDARCK
jgi:iron complex transport system ATP-binding protein